MTKKTQNPPISVPRTGNRKRTASLKITISIIISGAKNGQNGEEICQVQGISEKDCLEIGCCQWNDTGYSLSDQHIFFTN